MAKVTYTPPEPVPGTVTLTLTEQEAVFIRDLIGRCTGHARAASDIWHALNIKELLPCTSGVAFQGHTQLIEKSGTTEEW